MGRMPFLTPNQQHQRHSLWSRIQTDIGMTLQTTEVDITGYLLCIGEHPFCSLKFIDSLCKLPLGRRRILCSLHLQITRSKTHTHTQPLNGLFSRTIWVGRNQKDKPFWIFLKQRWWGGNGIGWNIRRSFAPRSRQITTPAPHHSSFYGQDALPDTQPTASKHWRL